MQCSRISCGRVEGVRYMATASWLSRLAPGGSCNRENPADAPPTQTAVQMSTHSPCLPVCWVSKEQRAGQCTSPAVRQVHAAVHVCQQAVAHAVRLAGSSSQSRPPAGRQGIADTQTSVHHSRNSAGTEVICDTCNTLHTCMNIPVIASHRWSDTHARPSL
jgi:hypothetical protein